MEQKHFVVVSTVGGKLNIMGAMQHNQSTCPNNLSIFVLRITCNLIPWVI